MNTSQETYTVQTSFPSTMKLQNAKRNRSVGDSGRSFHTRVCCSEATIGLGRRKKKKEEEEEEEDDDDDDDDESGRGDVKTAMGGRTND